MNFTNVYRAARRAVPELNLINSKKSEKRTFTGKLRFAIMERDNFRCVLCGASAKQGAELVVDHIIPFSQGGKTTLQNGQTLCTSCNNAKSDHRINTNKETNDNAQY